MNVPNLLSGNYLFSDPTQTASAAFAVLTAAFAVAFLASAFAYWRRARLSPQNTVLRRFIRRAAKAGMWAAGLGLFLALMRYVQFPFLSARILMLLLIVGIIGAVGYFVYDFSERYPLAVWKLQQSEIGRRYRPAPKRRAEPQAPRPAVRGKRRR